MHETNTRKGTVNRDIRDSVPDRDPYLQPQAPKGGPNILMIVWDDVGYGAMDVFGGPVETPTMRRIANMHTLQQRSHHGALLTYAILPAYGPQRHQQQHGLHHGVFQGSIVMPERSSGRTIGTQTIVTTIRSTLSPTAKTTPSFAACVSFGTNKGPAEEECSLPVEGRDFFAIATAGSMRHAVISPDMPIIGYLQKTIIEQPGEA